MKSPQSKLSRRNFLFAVGSGSAAAGAALVAGQGAETDPNSVKKVADSKGYRLTAHIQNYYRTTKV
jgi:hypothetical protein